MAAWITASDVTAIYPDADVTDAFIVHVQALAEVVIGTQDDPSDGLKAVFTDVVHRKHLSTTRNPEGLNMEVLGSYTVQHAGAPGLGLTRNEKQMLRQAVGKTGPWILPTTRGDLETAPREFGGDEEWLEGALP